jgi:hypothetical protein
MKLQICKHFIIGLIAAFSLFISSNYRLAAQCNPQFNQQEPICVNYCLSGNCPPATVSITCPNIQQVFWSTKGGVQIVPGSQSVNGNTYSVQVRSIADNFCRGQLTVAWIDSGVECDTIVPVGNQRSILISKIFTQAQINASPKLPAALNQDIRVIGNTPNCVSANGLYTFSIFPINQCPNDGLGIDDITWTSTFTGNAQPGWQQFTEVYRSSDNSSITVRMPPAANMPNGFNISAKLGVCNTAVNTKNITVQRAPSPGFITITGPGRNQFTNITDNNGINPARACLPANANNSFTLTCNPNEGPGITYQWDVPPGYNHTALNSRTITVTPTPQAQSGLFICNINPNSACGKVQAVMNITRSLHADVNQITVTPAINNNCVFPGTNYTFTITNAPIGNTYLWEPTSGTSPFWNIIAGQGTASITATPIIPINNTETTINLQVQAIQRGTDPATACGGNINRTFNLANSPVALKILQTGSQFNVVRESDDSPNWAADFGCTVANIIYTWRFVGSYQSQAPPITPPCTTAVVQCTTGTGCGNNPPIVGSGQAISLVEGCYNGVLRVTVQSGPNCTNCRQAILELPLSGPVQLPVGGGGGGGLPITDNPLTLPRLLLTPNPASKELKVKTIEIDAGGWFYIKDISGRALYQTVLEDGDNVMELKNMPRGIYITEYVSPAGKRLQEKLIVE